MSIIFYSFDIDVSPIVNIDIYQRTLRIEERYSREEALKPLNNIGTEKTDITGMYGGGNSPWNDVFNTRKQVASINVDGIKYLAKLIVDLSIHWLPLYISDDFKRIPCPFRKINRSYKRPDHSR
ncbi:hypothetical protein ACJMK2_017820 [Sinanodonta woodiana]|uniref:Uncharacterized protein n=1 Tax=Sinanodonta woodiana TaxID=1069815 RepID=A0ABD3UD48_SINWO